MPDPVYLRTVGQVTQVAQHAPFAAATILAGIICLIARVRADEQKDALENLCWENGDELARSHTRREVRLPADINRTPQCLRRARQLVLLLVLFPTKGEPHGDGGDGMAVTNGAGLIRTKLKR